MLLDYATLCSKPTSEEHVQNSDIVAQAIIRLEYNRKMIVFMPL